MVRGTNGQTDKQMNRLYNLSHNYYLKSHVMKFQMHVLDGGVTWKLITVMMVEPFRGELLKKEFHE